jgi:hypothetical protein
VPNHNFINPIHSVRYNKAGFGRNLAGRHSMAWTLLSLRARSVPARFRCLVGQTLGGRLSLQVANATMSSYDVPFTGALI